MMAPSLASRYQSGHGMGPERLPGRLVASLVGDAHSLIPPLVRPCVMKRWPNTTSTSAGIASSTRLAL